MIIHVEGHRNEFVFYLKRAEHTLIGMFTRLNLTDICFIPEIKDIEIKDNIDLIDLIDLTVYNPIKTLLTAFPLFFTIIHM